jgi:hypothetical protein
MDDFAGIRKRLNQDQKALRTALTGPRLDTGAFDLFFQQHRQLHSAKMSAGIDPSVQAWSYEDALLNDLSETGFRSIPGKSEHSIAWAIWHIARIEDVTMNLLVAGTLQVFHLENWANRLNVDAQHTGNGMNREEIEKMSLAVNIEALRMYRINVGRRTTSIVSGLSPQQLKVKVNPDRVQRLKDDGTLRPSAYGIADYWGRRNIAGLLLMPATRHNLIHLNEAFRLKSMQ